MSLVPIADCKTAAEVRALTSAALVRKKQAFAMRAPKAPAETKSEPPAPPALVDLPTSERKGPSPRPPKIAIADIIEVTMAYYKIGPAEWNSIRRNDRLVFARQVGMYIATKVTSLSFPQLGHFFRRDHTTVLHSRRKIEGLILGGFEELKTAVDFIIHELGNRSAGRPTISPIPEVIVEPWDQMNNRRAYLTEDVNELRRMYVQERWSIEQIASEMGRTCGAVEAKLRKIGLRRKRFQKHGCGTPSERRATEAA